MVLRRVVLGIGIALASLNIWTGAPLLALWIGSRTVGGSQATMLGVFVIAVLMGIFCIALVVVLARLQVAYDRATGAPQTGRAQTAWLRPMSGERMAHVRRRRPVTAPERIMIGSVVLAVVAFEAWFFFLASSPLPHGN